MRGLKLLKNLGGSKDQPHLPANLQGDEAKFKTILNTIDDGVILIDDQNVIQLMNPGASTICGWPAGEATGIDIHQVIKLVNDKGGAIDDADNPLRQIFHSEQSLQGDKLFLLTRENKQMPVRMTVSPLLDNDKRVT